MQIGDRIEAAAWGSRGARFGRLHARKPPASFDIHRIVARLLPSPTPTAIAVPARFGFEVRHERAVNVVAIAVAGGVSTQPARDLALSRKGIRLGDARQPAAWRRIFAVGEIRRAAIQRRGQRAVARRLTVGGALLRICGLLQLGRRGQMIGRTK
ncbi:hypothetical protein AQ802_09060 [Burkholderia pseudomallei]|uniref:Uncharacterized protein n=2 Tax=Burkholderia pseudomallei TaxID=28450 RepID=A0A0E1W4J8_BURPE|nr:hypothetical protein [Burkholderia pseudomallei]ABN95572.1 hypothetical protein BURPS1106A_A1910 [Burkholderia pseudomallei 1106a]AFR19818.1 hypothetical protein BPC006_II1891 [Burkholderia pseudomallei BPC006]EDS83712.1 hypothetical protein BURPSS13_X0078 [Burkholderia pseudomallei S13]EEC31628.1 conserved hypothetical protein [Burkholderia pseudomallei 576]EEH24857.1 conserved hypothetical protein [Burkholderia pseudomallei Pakistan 9]EEP49854.1 conserved hypothetical protein [Burkholder